MLPTLRKVQDLSVCPPKQLLIFVLETSNHTNNFILYKMVLSDSYSFWVYSCRTKPRSLQSSGSALLTISMEKSSSQANMRSASQKIPILSSILKVYYRVYKRL